ncbi:hypothetical protein F3Y22_tig00111983pilonHSYRG00063 [Hibiscus syriacus]|uniref:Uncharacterized protein n=1 Tax=Hibiscus syriacus TaxID=106335 RepID=A0A6A2Y5D0_HIBSY|nr:uncharacterized protein LOC120173798 [Hibiscus syriacus]KAE8671246.1 hypothetical protein F3Y22_tig00111983pilonHSYRG00063 [Hibiscus syriacus]
MVTMTKEKKRRRWSSSCPNKEFQEARDRRRDELRQREEITEKKQNKARRLNEQSSWVPCFEWADFTEDIEFPRSPIIFPTPYNNTDDIKKKQRDDDGLDLKLTL